MSTLQRSRFERMDKRARTEITKRMRRFGFAPYRGGHYAGGGRGLHTIEAYFKGTHFPEHHYYPNPLVCTLVFVDRNLQRRRKIGERFNDVPFGAILVRVGIKVSFMAYSEKYSGVVSYGWHDDCIINAVLSDLFPKISGVESKRKPMIRHFA